MKYIQETATSTTVASPHGPNLRFHLMEMDVNVGHRDTRDFLNGIILNQSLGRQIPLWAGISID